MFRTVILSTVDEGREDFPAALEPRKSSPGGIPNLALVPIRNPTVEI